jgi:hypothetical protein
VRATVRPVLLAFAGSSACFFMTICPGVALRHWWVVRISAIFWEQKDVFLRVR